jgi:hypothetical protein
LAYGSVELLSYARSRFGRRVLAGPSGSLIGVAGSYRSAFRLLHGKKLHSEVQFRGERRMDFARPFHLRVRTATVRFEVSRD